MAAYFLKNGCLLTNIANDNERAFEVLFNTYKDRIYSIAMLLTQNKAYSEEIVQDVFTRIWKFRKKLTEIENFDAWITTVARHRSLTVLKQIATENINKRAFLQSLKQICGTDTEHNIQQKELQILLCDALNRLTPQQRRIFELSRLQGEDRHTISRTLGLSPATVSVHLTIALRTVRSFLHKHQYETLLLCIFISVL
ncbi:MAG: sigma-70 family RNA polymerase sigma factor [Arachidicoccus sp.]|nr:sigma-70 family RNA polymerase sigma factor [Arachidicoccus sp.]